MDRREFLLGLGVATALPLLPAGADPDAVPLGSPEVDPYFPATLWLDDFRIAGIQCLSVTVTREVAALYGFGDPNPKAFVKGKRSIAGTCVLADLNPTALQLALRQRERKDQFAAAHFVKGKRGLAGNLFQERFDPQPKPRLHYPDQLPELRIEVHQENLPTIRVEVVLFLNAGWGCRWDSLTAEHAFSFLAKRVEAWDGQQSLHLPHTHFQPLPHATPVSSVDPERLSRLRCDETVVEAVYRLA